jgi:ferric-dicitrate binding protein FerR (iron transport regulator)
MTVHEKQKDEIHETIIRVLQKSATAEEVASIRFWCSESPLNEKEFAEIRNIWQASKDIHITDYNPENAWDQFIKEI